MVHVLARCVWNGNFGRYAINVQKQAWPSSSSSRVESDQSPAVASLTGANGVTFLICRIIWLRRNSNGRDPRLRGSRTGVRQARVLGALEQKLAAAKIAAEQTLLDLTPVAPGAVEYGEVWPRVLAKHVVRVPDINQMASRLRKEGKLLFLDWEAGKRVPQANYRMQKP